MDSDAAICALKPSRELDRHLQFIMSVLEIKSRGVLRDQNN